MDESGALDENAFRHVYEYNVQAGVHGFWIAGGTGESVMIADEENMRMAEIAAEQNKGRVTNIMHVGAITTARACALAEHAAKCGVESICAVPPFFYKPSVEALVEHYRAIGEASGGIPLFVYNLPGSTGTVLTPGLMRRIQEGVPSLKGLKHSSSDSQVGLVSSYVGMGLTCFIGNGRLMLPAMIMGAQGCIDGPPCMAPDPWVKLYDAIMGGDIELAKTLQEECAEVSNLVVTPHGCKGTLDDFLGRLPCASEALPLNGETFFLQTSSLRSRKQSSRRALASSVAHPVCQRCP